MPSSKAVRLLYESYVIPPALNSSMTFQHKNKMYSLACPVGSIPVYLDGLFKCSLPWLLCFSHTVLLSVPKKIPVLSCAHCLHTFSSLCLEGSTFKYLQILIPQFII